MDITAHACATGVAHASDFWYWIGILGVLLMMTIIFEVVTPKDSETGLIVRDTKFWVFRITFMCGLCLVGLSVVGPFAEIIIEVNALMAGCGE